VNKAVFWHEPAMQAHEPLSERAPARLMTYLINLDRSRDRLTSMVAQLDSAGLAWKRVAGVDGSSFGELPWAGYDHRAYDRNWGKSPHPGEVGCFLSHVRALQAFLEDDAAFGLILEDDCRFSPDLRSVLDDLIECAGQWDVVKLSGKHSGMPMTVETLPHGRRLVALLQRQTGSAAYLVNRKAAQVYVSRLLPMNVPYDHTFDQVWRFGLTLRGIVPLAIGEGAPHSTIGYHSVQGAKKIWFRRAGVLGYRTRTEIRRVLHYLFTDTRWFTRLFVSHPPGSRQSPRHS
jgi:glycosyl transferase, family 25